MSIVNDQGQPILLAEETDILATSLIQSHGQMTDKVAKVLTMMEKNDPQKTLIHPVATLIMFRLLADYGGTAAIEQWDREMTAVCGEMYPYRKDAARDKPRAAPVSVNPVLAAREAQGKGQMIPDPVPAALAPQAPQQAASAPQAAISEAEAEEIRNRARAVTSQGGPEEGVIDWGRNVPAVESVKE